MAKKSKGAVYCQCLGLWKACPHKPNACPAVVGQLNAFFPPRRLLGPTRAREPVQCDACKAMAAQVDSAMKRALDEELGRKAAEDLRPGRQPTIHWSHRKR